MSESNSPALGAIAWCDLTTNAAHELRDFYAAVADWKPQDVSMGDYADYAMAPRAGGTPVAGVCHAQGVNADMPPQWLIYIVVADVDAAAEACRQRGGAVVVQPREMGSQRCCVIRDPAGAVAALITPAAD